jgi:hypothetical protein
MGNSLLFSSLLEAEGKINALLPNNELQNHKEERLKRRKNCTQE